MAVSRKAAFLEQSKRVPDRLRGRSAMGPGRQLRLSVALQRITVTFSRIFDEASLIGEERRNVGRTQTKLAFTEDKNRATSLRGSPWF